MTTFPNTGSIGGLLFLLASPPVRRPRDPISSLDHQRCDRPDSWERREPSLFSGHGSPFFAWKRPRGLPVRCKPDLCIGDDFFPLQSSISAPQVQVGVYCCSCHASRSYCFRGHVPRSSSASHKIETIFLGTWPGKIMDGLFRARMSVLSYRSAR